ncbi:MAG: hypothetical protein D6731_17775 [Planctomycetota bacterium]|nr:MAG: hypothetical protein D6731_17775 [Planctomycetota bacterium]
MHVERLDAVLIRSPRAEAMVRFYRDLLGLPLEKEEHGSDPPHWGCFLAGLHFAIHAAPDRVPGPTIELSFSTPDVDGDLASLKEAGVPVLQEAHDRPFGRLAAVRDPDGNVVYLHRYPEA